MTDREKVVRAVETCFDSWIDKHRSMGLDLHKVERMKRDALELLKEQEHEKNVYTWICPKCDSQIILKTYKANKAIGMSIDCCPVCGKKVLYGKAD